MTQRTRRLCATYAQRSFSSKQELEGLSQFVNRTKSDQIFGSRHMDFSYFNNEQMSSSSTVEALSSVYLFASLPAQTIREFSYWLLFNRKPCAFTLCWAGKLIWHGWTSKPNQGGREVDDDGQGIKVSNWQISPGGEEGGHHLARRTPTATNPAPSVLPSQLPFCFFSKNQ